MSLRGYKCAVLNISPTANANNNIVHALPQGCGSTNHGQNQNPNSNLSQLVPCNQEITCGTSGVNTTNPSLHEPQRTLVLRRTHQQILQIIILKAPPTPFSDAEACPGSSPGLKFLTLSLSLSLSLFLSQSLCLSPKNPHAGCQMFQRRSTTGTGRLPSTGCQRVHPSD